MKIDKRALNPFFKKTNSTPKDLLDWVEYLMKECSDKRYPCMEGHLYRGKYTIWWAFCENKPHQIALNISNDSFFGCVCLWWEYVRGNKQPLLGAIKEFKVKYDLD